MGERKRKRRKYKTQVILSEVEKQLVKLEQVAITKKGTITETCRSLIRWYISRQYWTPKQWKLVEKLTAGEIIKKTPDAKFYLYAISDGVNVKIGFSTNVEKRKRSIQTGNAGDVKTLWKYFVGYKIAAAKREEKRLHRVCAKYHIRGEWFESGCMHLVEAYSMKT